MRFQSLAPARPFALDAGQLMQPRALFGNGNERVEALCRERTAAVYIGNDQMLSRVLGRFKMLTDTSDAGFAPHIIMDGYWEIWLTRWMVENVQPGWTAIDVGSNYGYYSVLLAELVGADGRLIAFEPNPQPAWATAFALEVNGFAGRSEFHQLALSSSAGTCAFFVPDNQPKNGHLVFGTPPESGGASFEVPIATLDSKCASLDRVDFIKIDAEGAESSIFEGMQETIARHNPLIVLEFNSNRGDAMDFANQLQATYPAARYLGEDGQTRDLAFSQLSSERQGQDWLLVLQK